MTELFLKNPGENLPVLQSCNDKAFNQSDETLLQEWKSFRFMKNLIVFFHDF